MAHRDTDWLNATWQRTSRALRRVTGRDAAVDTDSGAQLAHLRQLYPAEVAALLDLGLSDGAVAAYLLDRRDVESPRRAAPPRAATAETLRGPVLYRALGRVSAAAMRKQARRLMADARGSADDERRETLTAHAFELTIAAEELECRAAEAAQPPVEGHVEGRADERAARTGGPGGTGPGGSGLAGTAADPCAPLRDRARRWRLRADEYRTIANALDSGGARESYLHLSRAYETLAEQFEARAKLATTAPPRPQ